MWQAAILSPHWRYLQPLWVLWSPPTEDHPYRIRSAGTSLWHGQQDGDSGWSALLSLPGRPLCNASGTPALPVCSVVSEMSSKKAALSFITLFYADGSIQVLLQFRLFSLFVRIWIYGLLYLYLIGSAPFAHLFVNISFCCFCFSQKSCIFLLAGV